METKKQYNVDSKLSCDEIQDILDEILEHISWMRGVAVLIESQCEISGPPNGDGFLSKTELGNVGSLIEHHLKEVETATNKLYAGGILNDRDK